MRRILACFILILGFAVGLTVPGLSWWVLAVGLAIVGTVAWRLSTCPHTPPLALLPPTVGFDGARLPARWYCDACGRTWTADFQRDQTPVRRFSGYDASKAVHAARRAAELEERQRALAIERAGLKPARRVRVLPEPTSQIAMPPEAADIVPIGQGRRLAG